MKIFSYLYEQVLRWVQHPRATYYLAVLSFSEAVFFPVPVDVMLAPMTLTKPEKGYYYALIATITSVLGGIIGYSLGALAFEPIVEPLIAWAGYEERFQVISHWLNEWGFWVIFLAGFSPIPYKIFTVGAGALGILFFPFVLASVISRGARYFLVAFLTIWGGKKIERVLHKYIDLIGWITLVVVVIYIVIRS